MTLRVGEQPFEVRTPEGSLVELTATRVEIESCPDPSCGCQVTGGQGEERRTEAYVAWLQRQDRLRFEAKEFTRGRLQAILDRPGMWGPPIAVETQVLGLLEILHKMEGKPESFIFETTGRFSKFKFGKGFGGPRTLADDIEVMYRRGNGHDDLSQTLHQGYMREFVLGEIPQREEPRE